MSFSADCSGLGFETVADILEGTPPFDRLDLRGRIRIGPETDRLTVVSERLDTLVAALRVAMTNDPDRALRVEEDGKCVALVTGRGCCPCRDIPVGGASVDVLRLLARLAGDFARIAVPPDRGAIGIVARDGGFDLAVDKGTPLPCAVGDDPRVIAGQAFVATGGNVLDIAGEIPEKAGRLVMEMRDGLSTGMRQ